MRQRLDFLWAHSPVIDANIINQAGPEGAWIEIHACSDLQSAEQSTLITCVRHDFHVINVQDFVGTVPYKADAVPVAICDYCMRI